MAFCCKNCCKGVYQNEKKTRRNLLLQRALRCRGDWIQTSDLLNPIQAHDRMVGDRRHAVEQKAGSRRPEVSEAVYEARLDTSGNYAASITKKVTTARD